VFNASVGCQKRARITKEERTTPRDRGGLFAVTISVKKGASRGG
jgi:hypothetical protein